MIAVFVARAVRHATDRWMLVGLVLVLGGALGNLVDRLVRSPGFLRGHVVDFVAVGSFPVFNFADSCITIGAILLIVRTLFAPRRLDRGADPMIDGPITVPAALDGDRVDRALVVPDRLAAGRGAGSHRHGRGVGRRPRRGQELSAARGRRARGAR